MATGFFSSITPFQRGVRYLMIAKHCAQNGAEVKVGGEVVGSVTWTAPDYDLEMVRVDPNVRRTPVCTGASQLHNCFIKEDIFPRAFGRVFLDTPFGERPIPMRAGAQPGADETFCTSGSSTGVNCSWTSAPTPARGYEPGEVAAAHASGIGVIMGDSGGPVVGVNGQFYGIIVTQGLQENVGLMGYIPASRVLGEVSSNYALADPN
ncbi:serine protease [Clavibacter sp. VKM Ac-2873]|uniref:serine protease n=1 Tax=Clavibacter sp. VKM Ac-2873 TaxID=2783813 RepID=UPI00188B76C8|nr:serine protease [Clavibacter sp. VKM Ac-2873]MBF4619476.1 serine protease [Clavibacter sp. VKM Ac-2873]